MSGSNDLDALLAEAERAVASADTSQALTEVRARFLGRKGSLSELLRGIGELSPEARGRAGQAANDAKRRIEALVAARREALGPPAPDHARHARHGRVLRLARLLARDRARGGDRLEQLRGAEHPARSPGARRAGH